MKTKPIYFLLILLGIVALYFLVNTLLNKINTISPTVVQEKYTLRNFNITENFWGNYKYPTELTQTLDNSLIPISCTDTYSKFDKVFTSYDEKTNKSQILTDTLLLNYIQTLDKKYDDKTVNAIFSCSSQQGKNIVVYSLGPCGGGCSGLPYIGLVNGSDIIEIAKISDNTPYFECSQPLQLTKDNNFYFKCGGGDGPFASATIYKLSLKNFVLSKAVYCVSGVDEAGQEFSECK